jgi:hypothetical protein
MPDNQIKPHVVVHYTREPREDAQFARGLAERIRRVGFEVTRTNEGSSETILAVNNERLDDDPELLRLWVHPVLSGKTFTKSSLAPPRGFCP